MKVITPGQCRAARALLNMTQPELAEAAGINVKTIVNFETESRATTPAVQTVIKLALEKAGVIFIEENGDGPGVRLRKLS